MAKVKPASLKEAEELGVNVPAGVTEEKLQELIAEAKNGPKTLKVKITEPVAGKFSRSEPVGWVGELPENLAKEMIAAKYAEKAK